MESVTLGTDGAPISRLGFGCCPMGGHGWGETNEQDFADAVHLALECGITLFDTADAYGLGRSEELLAEALGKRRQDVVVASKFGVRVGDEGTFYDNSPAWMARALDASLERLRTDWIDLYTVHYWDEKTPPEAVIEFLERARDAGKIRHYGVSNLNPLEWLPGASPTGLAAFSNEFSLARRDDETEIARVRDELGLTFMSWGSLGQGILSGKYDETSELDELDRRSRDIYVNFHGDKLRRNLAIVNELVAARQMCGGKTPAQISVRWILDRLEDSVALVGMKTPEQVEANLGALGWQLPGAIKQRLDLVSADPQAS